MRATLSVLCGKVKTNPSSFIAECYSVGDDEELAQRIFLLRTIKKCPEKEQLLGHLINHENSEIRKLVRLAAKDDGLKIRMKRKT
jgi:hypothetical protein